MTPREDDHHNDREHAAEVERRLELLRKEAHDQALERILKDRKESSR